MLGLGEGRVVGAALSDSQAINQMQTEQQAGISLADVLAEVSAVRDMAAVVEYDYLQPHMPWSRPALCLAHHAAHGRAVTLSIRRDLGAPPSGTLGATDDGAGRCSVG